MSDFHFDIDAIASNEILKTDKTSSIISQTNSNQLESLQFWSSLSPEQQTAIEARVPQLVDRFLEDQNQLLDFGKEAVESINMTVNHLLKEQRKLTIPEVDDLFLQVNREVNGFVTKYKDVSAVELEKKPNFFSRLFDRGKNSLQELHISSQSIESRMDSLAATVVKQEDLLARNIVSAERLIEENTKSIENLVGVICFIEASQKEASQRAKGLQEELSQLDSQSANYHMVQEQLGRMTEVVNTLEQQRTEYISRLYVAWATTPQMRNLVKVSSDSRQRLGMLRRNTLPTMKLTLAQLGMMQQSLKAGQVTDAIINANNAALAMLAETSKEVIPDLERVAQRPSMSVEAVTSLAQSLVEQNNGIVAAIEEGRRKRQELEAAIVRSAEVINDSIKLRDEKIVQALLDQGQKAQKEVEASSVQ